MSELYVANCTKQNYVFAYRIPGENGVKTVPINIGQQIQVPGVCSPAHVEGVLKQHRRYGVTEVGEIDRTKPFIGICYSVDKKIAVDKIIRVMNHNDAVLQQRGQQQRRAAAVASNNLIEQHIHTANQTEKLNAALTDFEMTIEEQDPKGRKDSEEMLREGIEVRRDADEKETTFEKGRKKRGRRTN